MRRGANERFADARERRAGAAARAEAQEARRTEFAPHLGREIRMPAASGCPRSSGFDEDEVARCRCRIGPLERLTAERERIGPVNLVAEQELAELETPRRQRRRAGRGTDARRSTACAARSAASTAKAARACSPRSRRSTRHFRRLFTTLFEGGQAHLELVECDDPLEAGLEIMAQPPGKRLSTLTLLSGGEQALTAIALIFALFLTNPAPICVLDEVDAPLDDANIERFCDLLDRMTGETDTRYLIVTHNAVTMSRMHRLFGVTMIEKGVSRLVQVDLGGAETLLAAE